MSVQWWQWKLALACICTFLHMHVYLCLCWIWVLEYHASQPATHGFAATTLAHVESVHAGWQREGTLSVAHPGVEGLPAHLLSHHLGPCVCGRPASDPLGSSQCRRTSAISNLLVNRENNNQQTLLSALHTLHLPSVCADSNNVLMQKQEKSHRMDDQGG